jgi:hypothetical protein
MPSGTISLLRVETNSALINSEKSTTELNDPHYIELEDLEFNSRFRNFTTLRVS